MSNRQLSSQLTPKQIVAELDRHIVGQNAGKRAVAIALRNRWRRQQLDGELRDEVVPKNIIMIGPTGVGKTEIARRLAKLASAPFVKVEASKFTEVGYVGRDVDSMIRDLMEASVQIVREEHTEAVQERAQALAEDRLLDLLLPGSSERRESANQPTTGPRSTSGSSPALITPPPAQVEDSQLASSASSEEKEEPSTREKFRAMLREGKFDKREVEVEVRERSGGTLQVFSNAGLEEMGLNLQEMFGGKTRTRRRKMSVAEARSILSAQEAERLLDMDAVTKEALTRAEQSGIVFIDEIDKIAGKEGAHGPEVSRQGVQRDILPIVEGSSVTTKYGPLRTDHILFVAAGAFHIAKVSDLIPELQGRFPIRVELEPLGQNELERILREPRASLVRQYEALLKTEGIDLEISDEAISEIARVAQEANNRSENIGARRLHAVMEKLLEEISFEADSLSERKVKIDADFVRQRLNEVLADQDLARYIL